MSLETITEKIKQKMTLAGDFDAKVKFDFGDGRPDFRRCHPKPASPLS